MHRTLSYRRHTEFRKRKRRGSIGISWLHWCNDKDFVNKFYIEYGKYNKSYKRPYEKESKLFKDKVYRQDLLDHIEEYEKYLEELELYE